MGYWLDKIISFGIQLFVPGSSPQMIRFVESNRPFGATLQIGIFGSILLSYFSMEDFVRNRNLKNLLVSCAYAYMSFFFYGTHIENWRILEVQTLICRNDFSANIQYN